MLRLAADENFNRIVRRGLVRREPRLDIVRVQEVGLVRAADAVVLAWAASDRRVLLTHDVETMLAAAYQRVAAGLPMPGVVAVPWNLAVGRAIEDILLIALASDEGELEGQVRHVPL